MKNSEEKVLRDDYRVLNLDDYDVIVAAPTSGKTTFAEVMPNDVIVIDTDVIIHWMTLSWKNAKQLNKLRSLEWANQLYNGVEFTAHNLACMIFKSLQQFSRRPVILTNLAGKKWSSSRVVYVYPSAEQYVEVYNRREKDKRRQKRDRVPSDLIDLKTAEKHITGMKNVAAAFHADAFQLQDGQFLAGLFGRTVRVQDTLKDGERSYKDFSTALAYVQQNDSSLSLIMPEWIKRHATTMNEQINNH